MAVGYTRSLRVHGQRDVCSRCNISNYNWKSPPANVQWIREVMLGLVLGKIKYTVANKVGG